MAEDKIDSMNFEQALSELEKIVSSLEQGNVPLEQSIETISAAVGLSTAKVTATLISLQLKGVARQLPGNVFVRTGKK